jgi:poly(beta-D-mannuronate) lyase
MPILDRSLLALVLCACGDDATAADAGVGTRGDASAGSDAGSTSDASTGSDAGSTDDAGVAPDAGAIEAELPGELLDLSVWKLTLPTGEEGSPDEIFQPELDTFEIDPWFVIDGDAVRFRANAGGVTTRNSSYPRSELREMQPGGAENASWSTTAGMHSMRYEAAITHLPEVKPHVVAGQVHDAADDVVMIRLEGAHLFVEGNGEELGTLETDYVLGTRFAVRIDSSDGHIRVDYGDDGSVEVDLEVDTDGCYFKLGAYTQSNPERGDEPDAYGEVLVYEVEVTHAD